jgi:tRNA(His) guanylyltransferase
MLVKSGKSKIQAQDYLKGTQTREKNELLSQQFGIEYNSLPVIFRMGSSVFRLKTQEGVTEENGEVSGKQVEAEVGVDYSNIIDQCFWQQHPHILSFS